MLCPNILLKNAIRWLAFKPFCEISNEWSFYKLMTESAKHMRLFMSSPNRESVIYRKYGNAPECSVIFTNTLDKE